MVTVYSLHQLHFYKSGTVEPFSCNWPFLIHSTLFSHCYVWILLQWEMSIRLDNNIKIEATHGFKRRVAMSTIWISTETVISKIWSCPVKKGRDNFSKATRLVLSRLESTCLWIDTPTGIESGWDGLKHWVGL